MDPGTWRVFRRTRPFTKAEQQEWEQENSFLYSDEKQKPGKSKRAPVTAVWDLDRVEAQGSPWGAVSSTNDGAGEADDWGAFGEATNGGEIDDEWGAFGASPPDGGELTKNENDFGFSLFSGNVNQNEAVLKDDKQKNPRSFTGDSPENTKNDDEMRAVVSSSDDAAARGRMEDVEDNIIVEDKEEDMQETEPCIPDCYETSAVLDQPWPAYFLTGADEPSTSPRRNGAHEEELLRRYMAEETEEDLALLTQAQREIRSGRPTNNTGNYQQWTNDDDDEDPNFKLFSKYQKRLARAPTQVIRHGWHSTPLVQTQKALDEIAQGPPPCSTCGAPRVFEAQLLPTLIYEMKQRSTHIVRRYSNEDLERAVDFGNAFIFSCERNCTQNENAEEYIIVEESQ